jgi:hypothetical protein
MAALEYFIKYSAVPRTTSEQDCGGIPGLDVPNNTYGYGRIDALAACQLITEYEVGIPDSGLDFPVVRLWSNRPNPFNPTTDIRYELFQPTLVTLRIYDVSGRSVKTLLGPVEQDSGPHTVTWHGCDEAGREVPSGVYFYRLEAGLSRQTGRMALIR